MTGTAATDDANRRITELERIVHALATAPVARPIDIVTDEGFAQNVSLTTSEQLWATTTIAVPEWAVEAEVIAWGIFQMTDTSGVVRGMVFMVRVNDLETGGWTHDCPANGIANTNDMDRRTLRKSDATLGSTITVKMMARVSSGTNVTNIIRTRAFVFFSR